MSGKDTVIIMIFHQPSNSLTDYKFNTSFYTDTVWEYHFHRNLELIYVLKGAVNCNVNGVSYCLEEGDFGICLPCDIHRYEPYKDTLYWVLVFSEDYVRLFSKQISSKIGEGFAFRCNEAVENYIKSQLINNSNPSVYTLKSCLYAVCEEYLNSVPLSEKKGKELKIISALSDYILENHTKKITLSQISKKLGYDYNYMSRFFRNTFNMTFTDYVNIYRIETAIKLLEDTDQSITSVALESGFQSVRNFNYCFKQSTGKTPSEYRKRLNQNKE